MAYQRINTYYGNPWTDKIAAVSSGHFALYYPNRSGVAAGDIENLVLYDATGFEVARQQGAIGGFALAVAPNGEIVATVTRYGENGAPADRWQTGIMVAAPAQPPAPPPPPPADNTVTIAAIRAKMAELAALVDLLRVNP